MLKPYIIPFFIPFQGCPFHCVYCQQEDITDSVSKLPTDLEIQEKIRAYLKTKKKNKYSHVEVAFYGGTFTGLDFEEQKRLLLAVADFIEAKQVQKIRVSTKPDLIDQEQLLELKDLGLRVIELGVQSLDDAVLLKSKRGYLAQVVQESSSLLKSLGFELGHQLMPGLPGSGPEEAIETAEKSISIGPDFVRIYPTVVIEGTALARWYRAGNFKPQSLEQAISTCRAMSTLFEKADIPIIKMGLEFSGDEESQIIAGPYHKNFRQLLVENEVIV